MIAVIDYGVGNLFSLKSSLDFIGAESVVTSDITLIERADGIILPGVGAFSDAMKKLCSARLDTALTEQARKGKPLLGICLGMQMLFDKSFEYGEHNGLGLISGEVRPIEKYIAKGLKIPHMGWNSLVFDKNDELFKYISDGDYVYFVHSYGAVGCEADRIAYTDYGGPVTAAVRRGNVFGMQFHPEKSGETGLKLLKAFAQICGQKQIKEGLL